MIGQTLARTFDVEIVDLGDVIEVRKRPFGALAVTVAVGLAAALAHGVALALQRSPSEAGAVGELLELVAAFFAVLGFVVLVQWLALVVLPGARVHAVLDRRSRLLRVRRRTVSFEEVATFCLVPFGSSSTSVVARLRGGDCLRLWTVLAAQASRAQAVSAVFNGALDASVADAGVSPTAADLDARRFAGAILLVSGALWALAGFALYPELSLVQARGLVLPIWTLGLPAIAAGLWQLLRAGGAR